MKKSPAINRMYHVELLEPRLLLAADWAAGLAPSWVVDDDHFDPIGDLNDYLTIGGDSATNSSAFSALPDSLDLNALLALNFTQNDGIQESHAVAPDPISDTAKRHEVVIIDAGIEGYEQLVADFEGRSGGDTYYDIHVLAADANGVNTITEILVSYTNLDALHIVSHGDNGGVQLGDMRLDSSSIDDYAQLLNGWTAALGESADLLIYGCDLAASDAGQNLIKQLGALTQADVAASDDATGLAELGGDWDFEYSFGEIDSALAFSTQIQNNWSGLLASFTVNTVADTVDANPGDGLALDASGNTSLRAAIMEANALFGVDTINVPSGTYTLTISGDYEDDALTGDLDILQDLKILGEGAASTMIDAGGLDRGFNVIGAINVSMAGLTIQGGDSGTEGGGISNLGGTLDLTAVTIANNLAGTRGGGIYNDGDLTLDGVTISGNYSASPGGGLFNEGTASNLSLVNVTVSGNSSGSTGGGIRLMSDASLLNVTITDNDAGAGGGGISIIGSINIIVQNTIVAGNTAASAGPDVNGTVISDGSNIVQDGSASSGFAGGEIGVDPLLDPTLSDNGGPNWTHALLAGSPAIDAVAVVTAPASDQRGFSRDASPDIGAYEFGATVNGPPVAIDDGYDVTQDTTLVVDASTGLLANDTDPEFDPLTLYLFSEPLNGALSLNPIALSDNQNLSPNGGADSFPSWSPDGTQIAFSSPRDGDDEIFVINADGTGLVQLTSGGASERQPVWSPDGTQILYRSDAAGTFDIWVMDADGSNPVRLTTDAAASGASEKDADWSPDGTRIVYVMDLGQDTIYVMDADGSNIQSLTTPAAADHSPAWSPDGSQIVFISDRDGSNEIYVMDADGSNVNRLTTNAALEGAPAWSPDGTKILFHSNLDGDNELFAMDADGSNIVQITDNSINDRRAVWSPDGTRIAFQTDRDSNEEIYVSRIISDGGFSYTPDAGFTGVDSFTYVVSDGTSESAPATVTLTVSGMLDTDGDGLWDSEEDYNIDFDGDPSTNPGPDTDGDGDPNYLDSDDDGDGIPTTAENADPNADGDPRDALDTDRDGEPDYLDRPTGASNGTVSDEVKISDLVGDLAIALEDTDAFGFAVASIGDLNGDGVNDLVVGAPFDDDGGSDRGALYILFLNADGTVSSERKISDTEGSLLSTLDDGDRFGRSVASIGDLDGDGINEIVVGAGLDDDGGTDRGAAYVLFLNSDGSVRAEQKISSGTGGFGSALDDGDRFGTSVAGIGDIDGDGINDIAVGAFNDGDGGAGRGAAYVLLLNADGTVKAEQKISNTAGGLTATLDDNDYFGFSVAGIGDVDGDGINDIAVSARNDDDGGTDRGAVHVLFLNADGTVRDETKISDTTGGLNATLDDVDHFGFSVGGIGDVNGDGVVDIVVGATSDDDGGTDRGAVHILFLNDNGTVKGEQKISNIEGGLMATLDDGDNFGASVGGLGDFDGDGAIDIVVGSYADDDGGTNRGAVYILNLATSGVDTVAPLTASTNEDVDLVFSVAGGNAITVDDRTGNDSILRTRISVSDGVLNLATTAGLISVTGDGTDTVIVIGTESAINAALDGLTYSPTGDFNGTADLKVNTDLQAGLLGFYNFEQSGALGNDSSPAGGNDGAPSAPGALPDPYAVYDSVRDSDVLVLDGVDDNIQIPGLFGTPTSVTLAAWVNVSATNNQEVISLGASVALRLNDTGTGVGVTGFFHDGSGWNHTDSGQFIGGDGWHHVAFTFDDVNNTQVIYIDGVALGTTSYTESISWGLQPNTTIGSHGNGSSNWLNGMVDDALIYDRALSASEIEAIVNGQSSDAEEITITIDAVNDVPSFTTAGDQNVLEDSGPHTVAGFATSLPGGGSDEAGQTFGYTVSNDNPGLFLVGPAIDASGTLTYTLNPNAVGTTTVTVSVTDSGGTANGGVDTSPDQTFDITVGAVNDAPTFSTLGDQNVLEDAGPQTVAGFATALPGGGADESGQTFTYTVSSDNPGLFLVGPAIDASGTLTYTLNTNANGTARVTVSVTDSGGTANGGVDTAAGQTFDIIAGAVNDVPSFTTAGDQNVLEDAGPQTVAGFATALPGGGADESGQTFTYTVSSDNPGLFLVGPAIDASGTLTYTLNANANGTARVTVSVTDSGGTANGGVDTAAGQTFDIIAGAVNDVPSFTTAGDQNVLEDAGPQTVAGFATALPGGGADESGQTFTYTVSSDNPGLFLVGPAIDASGTLTYTLNSNANGTARVTVSVTDSGGTANGGVDTSADQTFDIIAGAVNDVPSFTTAGDQNVLEDAGPQTVAGFATALPGGGADESGQTFTYTVSSDNPGLFLVGPAIDASGTLTYTLNTNANGTARVTVSVTDSGGTANGGVDASAGQTFDIIAGAVNDVPSFTTAGDQNVLEDAGPQTVAGFATALPGGGADESGQTFTYTVSSDNPGLFLVGPAIDASGTLTYTLNTNANGTARVTVSVTDSGGTANGGVDTAAGQTFDIIAGAVNDVPSFTMAGDQNVLEDAGPQTVAGFATALPGGGADESGQTFTYTVSSDNPGLFLVGPAIDASGTLTYTLNTNANGTARVTVSVTDSGGTANGGVDTSANQTFDITTIPVANVPTATNLNQSHTYLEDSGPVALTDVVVTDSDAGDLITATLILSDPGSGNLTVDSGNGESYASTTGVWTVTGTVAQVNTALAAVAFVPTANNVASVTISTHIEDLAGQGPSDGIIALYVTPVNDAPTFTTLGDHNVLEDAGPQIVTGFATALPGGGNDEAGQTFSYSVSNDNSGLFLIGPAIDANGTLTYTVNPNVNGTATVTVAVTDSGGTANGGADTSVDQTFDIIIGAVNDAPSFSTAGDQNVLEGAGPQTVTGFASALPGGGTDEAGQTFTYTVSSDNPALFLVGPAIDASGTLTYTVNPNFNGSATVTVSLSDSGGTANGGIEDTMDQSFEIVVASIDDTLTATNLTQTLLYLEDSGPVALNDILVNVGGAGGLVSATLTLANTATGHLTTDSGNGETYSATSGEWTIEGTVAQVNAALAAVEFVPVADNDVSTSVFTQINNGAGQGPADGLITLAVTAVNDAPSGEDQIINLISNSGYTLSMADFGFADLVEGHAAAGVEILSVPGTHVVLTNLGVPVSAGQIISADDIAAGHLRIVFVGSPDFVSFENLVFRVQDAGGTTAGGIDLDPSPNVLTFAMNPEDESTVASVPAQPATIDMGEPKISTTDTTSGLLSEEPDSETIVEEEPESSSDTNTIPVAVSLEDTGVPEFLQFNGNDVQKFQAKSVLSVDTVDEPPAVQNIANNVANKKIVTPTPAINITTNDIAQSLDQMRDSVNEQRSEARIILNSSVASVLGLSVGYVSWLLRGGVLLSSVLSGMPVWRFVDPLPVFARERDDESEEGGDESLAAIVQNRSQKIEAMKHSTTSRSAADSST